MKLFFTSFIFSILSFYAVGQDMSWSLDDVDGKSSMTQLDDGSLLLVNKKGLRMVDPESGGVRWSIDNIKNVGNSRIMDEIPYLISEGKQYWLINPENGALLSSHDEKTRVKALHCFEDRGLCFFTLEIDERDVLECLDLNTNKLWSTQIADELDLGGLFSMYELPKPIINPNNTVTVFRKRSVHHLDLVSGELINSVEFKDDYDILGTSSSGDVSALLVDDEYLKGLSHETGGIVYDIKLKTDNPEAFVMGDTRDNLFLHRGKNYHLRSIASGEELARGRFDKHPSLVEMINDRLFYAIKNDLVELDPNTLEEIGRNQYDRRVFKLYTKDEKNIIVFGGSNNIIDLEGMKLQYPVKNDMPLYEYVLDTDHGKLFMYRPNDEVVSLSLLDTEGKQLWRSNIRVKHGYPSIDILDGGEILLVSDSELLCYDGKTGKKVWKNNMKIKPGYTQAFNAELNMLAFHNDGLVGLVDLSTAEMKFFRKRAKFKDFDMSKQTPALALVNEGVYVKGGNSIAFYSLSGEQIYNKHHKKSDNLSKWLKLANTAVMAGAVASGNTAEVVSISSNGSTVHKGSLVDGLSSSSSFANDLAEKRQKRANKGSLAVPYVFTKLESGDRGLIFFDMKSGEKKYEITTKEKDPNFIVDEHEKMLFYIDTKSKELKGYALK